LSNNSKAKKKGGAYEAFRKRLENHRQEIMDLYQHDLRVGQESSDEGAEDLVDRANSAYNRELSFTISDSERALLEQIDKALGRIEEGRFGACTSCGQAIAGPRLRAIPWARYCIDCQELEERGLLRD